MTSFGASVPKEVEALLAECFKRVQGGINSFFSTARQGKCYGSDPKKAKNRIERQIAESRRRFAEVAAHSSQREIV